MGLSEKLNNSRFILIRQYFLRESEAIIPTLIKGRAHAEIEDLCLRTSLQRSNQYPVASKSLTDVHRFFEHVRKKLDES